MIWFCVRWCVTELKGEVVKRDAELSELKIQIDQFHSLLTGEKKCREEEQKRYQDRIRDKHTELEQYRRYGTYVQ